MDSIEKQLFKRIVILIALISGIYALVFSFAIAPLLSRAVNDGTIPYLPDILETVMWITDLLVFAVCFGITIFAIYRFDFKHTILPILIYFAAIVVKYAINLLSQFFIFDCVPSSTGRLKEAITSILVLILLESLQYALIVLISFCVLAKPRKRTLMALKSAAKLNDCTFAYRDSSFPFTRIVNLENPIQVAALFGSLVVMALKVSVRIQNDIFIGLPTGTKDFLWMAFYYTSDVVFGVIVYLIINMVLTKFDNFEVELSK